MTGKTNASRHRPKPRSAGSNGTHLRITNGCFSGLKMDIKKKKTLLGSSVDCDICLDNNLVSDEHALITKCGPSCWIEDLNSKHGTFINGREVHRTKLKKGDKISMGNFELVFSG